MKARTRVIVLAPHPLSIAAPAAGAWGAPRQRPAYAAFLIAAFLIAAFLIAAFLIAAFLIAAAFAGSSTRQGTRTSASVTG